MGIESYDRRVYSIHEHQGIEGPKFFEALVKQEKKGFVVLFFK
jgi:hypothetical protein